MFPNLIRPAGLGASITTGAFAFSSTVVSPLGRGPLSALVSGLADDASFTLNAFSFSIPFFGTGSYGSSSAISVGSNSYITFGFGSTIYNGFSRTNPGKGLLIGAGDRSWNSLWGGGTGGFYRIRWEGNDGTGGTGGFIWEATFFNDGVIMLVTQSMFTTGLSTITDGGGTNFVDYTLNANSSIVFRPSGSTYTVTTGSYA